MFLQRGSTFKVVIPQHTNIAFDIDFNESTYWPDISTEDHRIWHTTGYWCGKGETITTNLPCSVAAQWAVVSISVISCRCSTQAKNKLIITLSCTNYDYITTVPIAGSVEGVLVSVRPDLQDIVGMGELE